ncbi:MAG: peptide chain release factor 2, partial [Holosporales bacterium]|nr:peptide chain release factor 2 [Holosporales bacterium]
MTLDPKSIEVINNSIKHIKNFVNFDDVTKKLEDIRTEIEVPDFWNTPDKASKIMKEKERFEALIKPVLTLTNELNEIIELSQLANPASDTELMHELSNSLENLVKKSLSLRTAAILSGKDDSANCFLEINAGAGGTEAQDWAEMLARMYSRWAESHGYKLEITDKSDGEEAGVKSITLHIKGDKAYGWLKKESGVHRLVRISPFDSNARRHTSFASVLTTPEVDSNIEIEINEKDLRIDTYRSSGAGGQHVNKTDSAVRITHIPSGVVTQSQVDRSQHRNKEIAMSMLHAKLYALKLKERENALLVSQNKSEISWGNQIRS